MEPSRNALHFDVCIIGAGPAGLAALSAVCEPYSLDQLSPAQGARAAEARRASRAKDGLRACVVDPEPWLNTWHRRFKALGIEWLRSPTGAHPDLFDPNALLAFAISHGRADELLQSGVVNAELKQLPEAHNGGWNLPSNRLFEDFCKDLAARLPHDFFRAGAASIEGVDGDFIVKLTDGRLLNAGTVVIALGVPGLPAIPPALRDVPETFMFHSDFQLGARLKELKKKRVLVVGGGLTAVQVVQLALRKDCQVTLCSRRPLTTRHFDVNSRWFDRRRGNQDHFKFFETPLSDRLKHIKEARGGGSVPPMYMEELRAAEAAGQVELRCGQLELKASLEHAVEVLIDGEIHQFDLIVNACGHLPDCNQIPLIKELLQMAPADIVGGFPVLSQDLQWGDLTKLFVVGALASLQVGPDAGNLMGIRRAAHIVANAMGVRDWLYDAKTVRGNIRANRFHALSSDTDSDSDDSTISASGRHSSDEIGDMSSSGSEMGNLSAPLAGHL